LIGATLFGGFRSQIIGLGLTLGVLFYMEGLMRTQVLPAVVLASILIVAIALPSVQRLPLVVQRSLAFLPIDIDPIAADNAAGSTEWRLEMWAEVLPEVPQYLILGKGLAINLQELDAQRSHLTKGQGQYSGSMLAGDYHNGPLSLIVPFGLFGTAGFIWFLVAGTKVLYRNYKYGDADLLIVNRFLLAQFIVKIVMYCLIFGSFYSDMISFAGILGFSIALNHGVAAPEAEPVARPVFNKFKLANASR
jgi:O-antigen ligase